MMKEAPFLLLLLALSFSLPAFPGAQGFGSHTVHGSGRHLPVPNTTIYRVTNLNINGPGSLLECLEGTDPRVCVFEVSGCIPFEASIRIRNPYLWIAGQTAPSPGICLSRTVLSPRTHDVLMQHVFVRTGDSEDIAIVPDNRDCIDVVSGAWNVVLDHVSMAYAIDETFTLWMTTAEYIYNITLSHSFVTHSLHESTHTEIFHGKGILLGPGSRDVTMFSSLLAHHADRNPLIGGEHGGADAHSSTNFEMVNNLLYNFQAPTIVAHNFASTTTEPQFAHFVSNYWLEGPNTSLSRDYYIRVEQVVADSRFWVDDPFGRLAEGSTDPWDIVRGDEVLQKSDVPLFEPQITQKMDSGDALLEYILTNAGARPLERDAEDLRVVEDVRSRGGSIINCMFPNVSDARCFHNAGGEPDDGFEVNQRSLVIPDAYWEVMPSGYTRLEEWIFGFSNELEAFACGGIDKEATDVCSGRGECVSPNVCTCSYWYSGLTCEKFVLPSTALYAIIGGSAGLVVIVFLLVCLAVISCVCCCCSRRGNEGRSAEMGDRW